MRNYQLEGTYEERYDDDAVIAAGCGIAVEHVNANDIEARLRYMASVDCSAQTVDTGTVLGHFTVCAETGDMTILWDR